MLLEGRKIQVVVRSYEHHLRKPKTPPELLEEDAGGSKKQEDLPFATPHKISDWHKDGRYEEDIIATAACYLEVGLYNLCGVSFMVYVHAREYMHIRIESIVMQNVTQT